MTDAPSYRLLSPLENMEWSAEIRRESIKRYARQVQEFGRIIQAEAMARDAETIGMFVKNMRPWVIDLIRETDALMKVEAKIRRIEEKDLRSRYEGTVAGGWIKRGSKS